MVATGTDNNLLESRHLKWIAGGYTEGQERKKFDHTTKLKIFFFAGSKSHTCLEIGLGVTQSVVLQT